MGFEIFDPIPRKGVREASRTFMSSLNNHWQLPASGPKTPFRLANCTPTVKEAEAYLSHAITEDAPLASVVRLHMTGEIKMKRWLPFTATQVVRVDRGFIWQARVKTGLTFISGFDRYVDGAGEMQWKILGLIPVMSSSTPDISRSSGDRYAIERVLLPSAFCRPEVTWTSQDSGISLQAPGISQITLDVASSGAMRSVSMLRWGNPDGGEFGLFPFGGFVDEETTWGGYTIPSRLRVGWNFGCDRFAEGEFFRAQITDAEFS